MSQDTFGRWIRSAGFADAVTRAEEECAAAKVGIVHRATVGGSEVSTKVVEKYDKDGKVVQKTTEKTLLPPNWQAAAWWLERRRNGDYGQRQRIDVTKLSAEQIAETLAADDDDGEPT